MDIRHIDLEVSVKKWISEDEEQNMYATLFSRRLRITMDTPLSLQESIFRAFLHERLDKIINELEYGG